MAKVAIKSEKLTSFGEEYFQSWSNLTPSSHL